MTYDVAFALDTLNREKISLSDFRNDPEIFDRIDLNIKMRIIVDHMENRSVDEIQAFFTGKLLDRDECLDLDGEFDVFPDYAIIKPEL